MTKMGRGIGALDSSSMKLMLPCVDHLERKGNVSENVDWVRPDSDDIQVVTDFQVIPSDAEGDRVD